VLCSPVRELELLDVRSLLRAVRAGLSRRKQQGDEGEEKKRKGKKKKKYGNFSKLENLIKIKDNL
jgi:hypothetical protein